MKEPQIRGRAKGRGRRRPGPALTPPPGGKALARLHLFQGQRGIQATDVARPPDNSPGGRASPSARPGSSVGKAPVEGSAYLAAFRQREKLDQKAPAVPIQQGWRPLGPFCMPHGQSYGSGSGSRPSVVGRVSSVAPDPGNANHILVGAAGGGVWESTDAGATWASRTDEQPSLAIGAIAFDPSNPSIVYSGTGEGDFFSGLGTGLLRSTDGGTTWTVRATTPFVGLGFFDLIVDPVNGSHLLAATSGGLFESTNAGSTWTLRRAQVTWDLSMHPTSTNEVLAGCADGVLRSTDGGTTWIAVTLPGGPPGTPPGWWRVEVCHAPSSGSIAYVFGAGPPLVPNPDDPTQMMPTAYLWRRTAFAGAFAAVTPPAALRTGQAWYDWFAATAPNNPDVLYLGGINTHKGIRSPSGTWTWTTISARATGDSIHPDQHAIAFSPTNPNVVYVGCDGGIFRSPDAGASWQSLNKGLCITEVEFLARHPQFDAWLLAGTQDNGTMRYEGEEAWYHVQDGDGGDCGVDDSSPYTCYHTYFSMGMERSTTGGGWGSWSWIGPNVADTYNALFYPPVEVNGSVVAQAGESVFISTNGGTSWTEVALPAVAGRASSLAIPSSTRVFAGTDIGRIYRIDSTGGIWQAPVALAIPRAGFVSDLLVDPGNPSRLWATYSNVTGGHVFRSDNAGGAWTNVSAGLPNIAVNAIEVDPSNTDIVWIAADVGVYRSTNAGGTWATFDRGLPRALAKDLVFHPISRLLRVGLQSRGVWEIAVDPPTMPDVEVYLRDSMVDTGRADPSPSGVADPFTLGTQTFWWQCTDVKVDSPPYQRLLLSDVDFEVFDDDHGVFASGLQHENAQRNRIVRVYAQVHNRGLNPATNAAVKVFFADASLGLPDLPSGFWTNFPNNAVPASSPWQPIAPYQVVLTVDAGRPAVVGFEWTVPSTAADHSCLLAIVSADNDLIATTELNIGSLVLNNRRCGLKNLAVVNPPPSIGAPLRALRLMLWPSGEWRSYSLGADRGGARFARGIVLSKHLSELAREAQLTEMEITEDEQADLERLIKDFPDLKEQLDFGAAYKVSGRTVWLKSFELQKATPEPLVVLVNPKVKRGYGSLVQRAEDGTVVGGFTLAASTLDARNMALGPRG
jgi:photosystem II stability/assembly factor-like uncharacterized protein